MLASLLLIAFVAFIVFIRMLNREDVFIFPNDRDSITAERADTENNAFYALVEAMSLLPNKPTVAPFLIPGQKNSTPPFVAQPNSISHTLGIALAEDDPKFLQFLRDAEAAIEAAKSALDRPFFRLQYPLGIRHGGIHLPPNPQFSVLYATWLAHANVQIRFWDERDAGVESLNQLAQIQRMMTDEPLKLYYGWETREFSIDYYKIIQTLARNTTDRETLDALDGMLRDQPVPHQDMVAVLDAHLRAIDDTYMTPTILDSHDIEYRAGLEEQISLIQFQNVAEFFIQELDELKTLAPKTIPEYEPWLISADWAAVPWVDYLDSHCTLTLFDGLARAHRLNGLQVATRITVLLEKYNLDHAAYPEALEALTPDYVKSVPISPATGQPFEYSADGNFYNLSDIELNSYGYRGRVQSVDRYHYVKAANFDEEQ
ncbi:MAG: hypothetical protein VCD00_06490 [Candidatus Hydrogenedentota bacterium]